MKKFISLLCAVSLVFLPVACGSSTKANPSDGTEENAAQLEQPTTVSGGISDLPDTTEPTVSTAPETTSPTEQVDLEAVKKIAQAYYTDTVFEVVAMELQRQTENEIVFSVCVSKGGVVQEPNRSISLELKEGNWEVVNEGY